MDKENKSNIYDNKNIYSKNKKIYFIFCES